MKKLVLIFLSIQALSIQALPLEQYKQWASQYKSEAASNIEKLIALNNIAKALEKEEKITVRPYLEDLTINLDELTSNIIALYTIALAKPEGRQQLIKAGLLQEGLSIQQREQIKQQLQQKAKIKGPFYIPMAVRARLQK